METLESQLTAAGDSAGTDPVYVSSETRGNVAWLMLERPAVANSQNFRMIDQLDEALRQAVNDDNIKVIVLGGRGKHFSAGHDLGTPEKDKHLPRQRKLMWYDHLNREGAEGQYVLEQDAYLGLCRRWQEIPKPMIAMVQGACIAGGLMLAWVCDMIVASDDAYFQDPVVRMGIPGVEYFAHGFELPPRIAREFLLLGERMPAARAYQYGMVNRVVPRADLEAEVARIATDIAERPRFGMALTKQAMNVVEELRGKRTAMDAVFHMHHLGHAHSSLTNGNAIGGMDAKAMASANKSQAGEG
jgi:enoyl-CoA hydratase